MSTEFVRKCLEELHETGPSLSELIYAEFYAEFCSVTPLRAVHRHVAGASERERFVDPLVAASGDPYSPDTPGAQSLEHRVQTVDDHPIARANDCARSLQLATGETRAEYLEVVATRA